MSELLQRGEVLKTAQSEAELAALDALVQNTRKALEVGEEGDEAQKREKQELLEQIEALKAQLRAAAKQEPFNTEVAKQKQLELAACLKDAERLLEGEAKKDGAEFVAARGRESVQQASTIVEAMTVVKDGKKTGELTSAQENVLISKLHDTRQALYADWLRQDARCQPRARQGASLAGP